MLIKDRQTITDRRYTDEGFLEIPAVLARTGIQKYFAIEIGMSDREPTEIVSVYRPPEEVFDQESMSSFKNKPVTNDHPPVMVDINNFKEFSVGMSGSEVTRDNTFMRSVLTITDADAIKSIEEGKVELSNGYNSEIEFKSGVTPSGEQYDAIQRNIRGNHIAIVNEGRCGVACRLADEQYVEEAEMKKVVIESVEYEVSDQVAQAVAKLQKRLSDSEEEAHKKDEDLEKEKKDKEKMSEDHKAQVGTLQAQVDDAKSQIPGPDQLDQLVENRIATRDAAKKICPDLDFQGKDCETIRKEVVHKVRPNLDMDTVTPEYIRATFDLLSDHLKSGDILDFALRQEMEDEDGKAKGKESGNVVIDAREKMAQRNREAWKTGSLAKE